MPEQTTNYGLTKQLPEEFYDRLLDNINLDTIDALIKFLESAKADANSLIPIYQEIDNVESRLTTHLAQIKSIGIGNTELPVSEKKDYNELIVGGVYRMASVGVVNYPIYDACFVQVLVRDSQTIIQLAFSETSQSMHYRVKNPNGWGSWATIYEPLKYSTLSLQNGWQGTLKYALNKTTNTLHLISTADLFNSTISNNMVIATLPTGHRPSTTASLNFVDAQKGSAATGLFVSPTGAISLRQPASDELLPINQMYYISINSQLKIGGA